MQKVPWLRIGAESIAIVVSILLAFSIDAWWGDRQQAASERQVSIVLCREVETNIDVLTARLDRAINDQALLLEFYELPESELYAVPKTRANQFFSALQRANTEDYSRSALAGFIDSGGMSAMGDSRISAALKGWSTRIGSLDELAANLSGLATIAARNLSRHEEFREIQSEIYRMTLASGFDASFELQNDGLVDLRPIRNDPDIRSTAFAIFQQRRVYQINFVSLIDSLRELSDVLCGAEAR